MHRAAPGDDIVRDAFVEVGINAVIHSCHLQWRLCVAIDSLHLGVENQFERVVPTFGPAKDKELAIADRKDCDHRVQFAMNAGAVVHDTEKDGRGTKTLGGVESTQHHRNWADVGLSVLCVWSKLLQRYLVACVEKLVRKLRGVDAKVLDLRDAVGDTEHHWRDQRRVCISTTLARLSGMSFLVRPSVEAQWLIPSVLLIEMLIATDECIEIFGLLHAFHDEGRSAHEVGVAAVHDSCPTLPSGH